MLGYCPLIWVSYFIILSPLSDKTRLVFIKAIFSLIFYSNSINNILIYSSRFTFFVEIIVFVVFKYYFYIDYDISSLFVLDYFELVASYFYFEYIISISNFFSFCNIFTLYFPFIWIYLLTKIWGFDVVFLFYFIIISFNWHSNYYSSIWFLSVWQFLSIYAKYYEEYLVAYDVSYDPKEPRILAKLSWIF